MASQPEAPKPPAVERLAGRILDLLRLAGGRSVSNVILRALRVPRRHESAVGTHMPPALLLPSGPFAVAPMDDAPAVLVFVPRSLGSRFVDAATGGYGYSHLAVDLGEVDEPSGRRVMIESAPGRPVQRSYQDMYGGRPYVRVPLAKKAGDPKAFSSCIAAMVGQPYDVMEAFTWGEVDDPARQICSDLAAVCLPRALLEDITACYVAGALPRRSVSAHQVGRPEFHAFVSPNGFAAYFGAPPGERLRAPDQRVPSAAKASRPAPGRGLRRHMLRARLIYNPAAGAGGAGDARLTQILSEMQRWDILPEVHIVTPESDVRAVAADALHHGVRLVVVAGGDGTIDNAAGALVGTGVALGIIPTGTRNNLALSLGIPAGDIPAAVALLRAGRSARVDAAHAHCGSVKRWFFEAGSVGLASALYPAADDVQHGDLTRIGDLLATFVSATPSELRLLLDGRQVVAGSGHLVLLANMPYFGAHFQPASGILADDGCLDVLVYGGLTKLDLIGHAVQIASGPVDDPRIAHYRAASVEVQAVPPMPVMADGVILGDTPLSVTVHPRALRVMAGHAPVPTAVVEAGAAAHAG